MVTEIRRVPAIESNYKNPLVEIRKWNIEIRGNFKIKKGENGKTVGRKSASLTHRFSSLASRASVKNSSTEILFIPLRNVVNIILRRRTRNFGKGIIPVRSIGCH